MSRPLAQHFLAQDLLESYVATFHGKESAEDVQVRHHLVVRELSTYD